MALVKKVIFLILLSSFAYAETVDDIITPGLSFYENTLELESYQAMIEFERIRDERFKKENEQKLLEWQSAFPWHCTVKISFTWQSEGRSQYELINIDTKLSGKMALYHDEHPTRGEYSQQGIIAYGSVCIYDENTKELNDSSSEFILIFLDRRKSNLENEECHDRFWTSFEEDKNIIVKIADFWAGTTAGYARNFAIAPSNVMINGRWLCT